MISAESDGCNSFNDLLVHFDLDFKLDQNDFSLMYRYLSDFAKNNNSQIISTLSSRELSSFFSANKKFELNEQSSIIQDIIDNKII